VCVGLYRLYCNILIYIIMTLCQFFPWLWKQVGISGRGSNIIGYLQKKINCSFTIFKDDHSRVIPVLFLAQQNAQGDLFVLICVSCFALSVNICILTSSLKLLSGFWPNFTGMIHGWSPTKVAQMCPVNFISRSQGHFYHLTYLNNQLKLFKQLQ